MMKKVEFALLRKRTICVYIVGHWKNIAENAKQNSQKSEMSGVTHVTDEKGILAPLVWHVVRVYPTVFLSNFSLK